MKVDSEGWVQPMRRVTSPNFDARPPATSVNLIVLHNISLPPGQFEGEHIERLFTNSIDPAQHPFLADVADLRVSAHFVIERSGRATQFVSCEMRAWHAGVSQFRGVSRCNDFSIGIELEGSDFVSFEAQQYQTLQALLRALAAHYPISALVGHSEIASGRKSDPGPFFEWDRLRADSVLAPLLN